MKVKCLNCENEFEKLIYEIKRYHRHFCSRSCSTQYYSNKIVKRTKTKRCKNCNTLIYSNVTYCKNCSPKNNDVILLKTKSEYTNNGPNKYRSIRDHAAKVIKNQPKLCNVCGYDRHVEVCHIKPISSFSDNSLICDINNLNNLIYLCPNHHWELDNNLIVIGDIGIEPIS